MSSGNSSQSTTDFEDLRTIPLRRIRQHQPLQFPIRSEDGVLLLSEGSVMTDRNLEALENRGIRRILVHRSEPAASVPIEARGSAVSAAPNVKGATVGLHTPTTRRLDKIPTRLVPLRPAGRPFKEELTPRGLEPYDPKTSTRIWKEHESFVTEFRNVLRSLSGNDPDGSVETQSILHAYLEMMTPDFDLFACFAASPHHSHYPYRHSLHVAMLSIALGLRAGLDRDSLMTLGMGALLHDLGMLRVPRSIWTRNGQLSKHERDSLMEHPIHTVSAMENITQIDDEVRVLCYQVHERSNGLGYPRQIKGDQIHPLAKIIAVADMYVALVSERPHRPAMLPYKAVETILRMVSEGWVEPAHARLLLETLALYPLGSYIILSDRRLAKVLRSNESSYHQPIVRVWPTRTPPSDETGEIIDLREHSHLTVLEAVPAPPL